MLLGFCVLHPLVVLHPHLHLAASPALPQLLAQEVVVLEMVCMALPHLAEVLVLLKVVALGSHL
jgi:hypothetical protein